jgi:hypothetical protein
MKNLAAGMFALAIGIAPVFADTAEDRATVLEGCASQLGLQAEMCTCFADKAEAGLTAPQYHLLAIILGDPSALGAAQVDASLTPEDMSTVSMFAITTPAQCVPQ